MSVLRALVWDVDGTLAESERDGHRVAFNRAFEALELPWRWDVALYGSLLGTAGGYERLMRDLATRREIPVSDHERLAREIHRHKNDAYAEIVAAGGIALRPGVTRLMQEAEAGDTRLAIATTTSRVNVAALLSRHFGANWADRFSAVVCGEDAPLKKPHPQVYQRVLEQLALVADEALAVEDSPAGVASATAARLPALRVRSVYFRSPCGAWAECEHLEAPVRCGLWSAQRAEWSTLVAWHTAPHPSF